MNDKVLNIHHNLISSAFTVMGDVLICIALYCMFCKVSGHILEDDFMQSVVVVAAIIRKSKFPQNPKRSVRFSGKRTKRSVQKRKARNTQKAETKVL